MKKLFALAFAISFALPLTSFAAINSIDGLTAPVQQFVSPGPNAANSMHMNIINVGTDTHRFKWDGSAWATSQGGTGTTTYQAGGILYYNGFTFTQAMGPSGSFFWDETNKHVAITSAGNDGPALFIVGETTDFAETGITMRGFTGTGPFGPRLHFESARGTAAAPTPVLAGQNLGRITFGGYASDSGFDHPASAFIGASADENFTSTASGASLMFLTTVPGTNTQTVKMRIAGNGNVGIGTGDPEARLDVVNEEGVGTIKIDGDTSCIIMKDSDGVGYSYLTINNGVLSASTVPCN